VVSLSRRDPNFANNYLEYPGESEAICETTPGVIVWIKTEGRKFRDSLNLNNKDSDPIKGSVSETVL
jgi:hypothetical protein